MAAVLRPCNPLNLPSTNRKPQDPEPTHTPLSGPVGLATPLSTLVRRSNTRNQTHDAKPGPPNVFSMYARFSRRDSAAREALSPVKEAACTSIIQEGPHAWTESLKRVAQRRVTLEFSQISLSRTQRGANWRYLRLLSLPEDPCHANTFVDAQGPPSAVVPPLHGLPTLSPRTLVRHRRTEMPHVRGPRPDTCNELSPGHAFRPNGGLHFCQAVRQTRPCGDGNMESTTNNDLLQSFTVRLLYAKQHIVHHS